MEEQDTDLGDGDAEASGARAGGQRRSWDRRPGRRGTGPERSRWKVPGETSSRQTHRLGDVSTSWGKAWRAIVIGT